MNACLDVAQQQVLAWMALLNIDPGGLVAIGIVTGLLLAGLYAGYRTVRWHYLPKGYRSPQILRRGLKEGGMDKSQRDHHIRQMVADALTDVFEDWEYRGIISRDEKNRWYKRLGFAYRIFDLLPKQHKKPKKLSKPLLIRLKTLARKNLAAIRNQRPLPIPDPPKEVSAPKINNLSSFFNRKNAA